MKFRNVAFASTAAVIAAVAIGSGAAQATSLITGKDVKDGSIHRVDLGAGINHRLDRVATSGAQGAQGVQGPKGDQGPKGEPGKDADPSVLQHLSDRISALESDANNGHDINTNWLPGEDGGPATIANPNAVVLDAADQGYSYASIKNLDLYVEADAHIQYTYRLTDGATAAAGSPRLKVVINGVSYSSVNQINPDYGHDNGDGTYTVDAVMTVLTDNSQGHNPRGTITRASLIHEGIGSVEFTSVSIDGQPISFSS